MRSLKATDVITVAEIILSAEGAVKELGEILYESYEEKSKKSEKDKTLDGIEMARIVLMSCLKHCKKDILVWFADVAGMSFEEFDNQGPKGIIRVIEHLKKQEGISGFFGDAFSLYQGTLGSEKDTIKT